MRLAFSSLACPGWSVEQIAAAATTYGFDGVEWRLADGALLGPETDDRVWDRINGSGAEAVCLDTSCVFVQTTPEARSAAIRSAVTMSERAWAIGAGFIRVFAGPIPRELSRAETIATTRDALTTAARHVSRDVQILVETHDAWSRGSELAELVDGLEGVGVVWDIAHTVRSGESPEKTLESIGRPKLVHVKDADGDALTHLGAGGVPLREAVALLDAQGYDGFLSFEWEKLWHPELDNAEVALAAAARYLEDLVS